MSPSPPFWAADPGWRSLQAGVRDALPPDWKVAPLAAGWHLLSVESPDPSMRWGVWAGGEQPPPRSVQVGGQSHPPHPAAVACWERAVRAPGLVLVLGIPGQPHAVGTEAYEEARLDADPGLLLGAMVRLARAWEALRRPGRPWRTRVEHMAALRAAEARTVEEARRRGEQERAQRALAAERTEARRAGWTVRRGHHESREP